jgi:hypothetical protein
VVNLVSLVRVHDNVFADAADVCRVLFRPSNPVGGEASISLDTDTVRAGFISFLKSPTPANQLGEAIGELDDFASRQDADPTAFLPRIIFGHADGGWSAIGGAKTGALGGTSEDDIIKLSIDRNSAITYRLETNPATLTVNDQVLLLSSIELERFRLRKLVNDAPSGAVTATALTIPLSGPGIGTIQATSSVAPDAMERLGFEIRFSQISAPYEEAGDTVRDVLTSRALPIRAGSANGQKPVSLRLVLDPLNPFDPSRTFIAPSPADGEVAMLSGYITNAGHDILLRPRTTEATAVDGGPSGPAFYFTRHPRSVDSATGVTSQYEETLSLRGHFDMHLLDDPAPEPTQFGLMPGPAASEVIPFGSDAEAAETPILSFDFGPSFDKRLPPAKDGAETASAADDDQEAFHFKIDGPYHGVTSWVRIANLADATKMRMITEPSGYRRLAGAARHTLVHDPVFMTTKDAGAVTGNGAPPTVVDRLASPTTIPAGFVPVLPIRGHIANGNAADLWQFQRNVLAVERAKLLTSATGAPQGEAVPLDEAPAVRKRTPLGFELEQQSESGPITAVRFARSVGSAVELSFGLIAEPKGSTLIPEVVDALVRNRLFLVTNRAPRYLKPAGSALSTPQQMMWGATIEETIGIAGWSFSVDLARPSNETPARPDTLVIIKGYEGRPIADLAQDTRAWSSPDAFLGDAGDTDGPLSNRIAATQKILKDFVTKVTTYAKDGSTDDDAAKLLYSDIAELVGDAKWSGVLAINVPLGVASLPTQVQGLIGGVDLAQLRAEYVAVEATPLGPDPAKRPYARLSALVDYLDANAVAEETGGTPYGFKVQRMQAQFANGELKVFNTKLRLRLGGLFEGLGSVLQGPRGATPSNPIDSRNLDLVGRYERRKEGTETKEIYTFETADAYLYNGPEGAIIEQVLLDRVAYITDRSTPDADPAGQVAVESRFVLDGSMKFGKLDGGGIKDILDIDLIDFTDLAIAFNFQLPKLPVSSWSIAQLAPMFSFSPPNLHFDFDRYKRRDDVDRGFLSSFPLKLTDFDWFARGASLGSLGFLSFRGFGADLSFSFGLEFDLDMGSLGALAGKLKAFKMKFLFGFTERGGDGHPAWGFGFKFDNAGGDGLEIGIEGVLKLISRQYGLLSQQYATTAGPRNVKLLYSLGTELQVFGHPLPPNGNGATLLLFVDPEAFASPNGKASAVGWFAGMAPHAAIFGDAIQLDLLALGQRVDPVHNKTFSTTREFVDAIQQLAPDLGDDPAGAISNVVTLLKSGAIAFDPNIGWSIGFRGTFFKVVAIDFAMRDPTLYGIRVAVLIGRSELFSLDVLYRRLTDKLGVYSLEFVPPSSWRQIEFGAVSVTLPAIGFELYTDGGFAIDLGYPRNNDWARSFGVQFLPFIGSGGLYFRRVSGPAAHLIPNVIAYTGTNGQPIFDDNAEFLEYKPVIETGIAFRVGLGKEIVKGPLRVGLSITVFATMEGGYGVRYFSGDPVPTLAAHTFIRVRGTVGVLGELYGYIDFGIVKAGVSIRVWVEIGFDLKTDYRTKLFIQAGVSVSVDVVIAEFSVFGHHVKISIHFSFATTIEYATYIGSDGPAYYRFASTEAAALLEVREDKPLLLIPTAVDWTATLQPSDWRPAAGSALVNLSLYLTADFTMAQAAEGEIVPEAVLMLLSPDKDSAGGVTPIGDLAAAMAGWALKATIGADPSLAGTALRDWDLDDQTIDRIAAFIAGDGVATDPAQRRMRLPGLAALETFLGANLRATIAEAPTGNDATKVKGVFFPLPPSVHFKRTGFTSDVDFNDVTLDTKAFVDDAYRNAVDKQFEDLILLHKSGQRGAGVEDAEAPRSLVSALFEEHLGLVIRSTVAKLAALARDNPSTRVGDLLDLLAKVDDPQQPHKSAGFEIFGTASRLFAHGPRLPLPADADTIPPTVPRDNGVHGLYRLAWLQVPLRNIGAEAAARLSVDATANWLAGPASIDIPVSSPDLAAATAAYQSLRQAGLKGASVTDHLYREVPIEHAARPPVPLDDHSLVRFPPELVRALAGSQDQPRTPLLALRPVTGQPSDAQGLLKAVDGATPVIAATIVLRRVVDPTTVSANGPSYLNDIVEIVTISENERVCLDWFENGQNGGAIQSVDLFNVLTDAAGVEIAYAHAAGAGGAVVVQTNLSTEIRPGQVPESALIEATQSVAETYVASLGVGGDPVAFVEIVRRAAIVNTGGTFIKCDGITTDKPSQFNLLMLVGVDPAVSRRANAFTDPNSPEIGNTVLVITTGETGVEPLADAGTWPMLVTRDDSAVADPLQQALCARFSMLAYEVVDENGALIGKYDASHSLSVGPTDDGQPAPADTEPLRYRVPLPLANLAAFADPVDPYAIVGRTIQLRTSWRDIYGNAWPDTDGGTSDRIAVGYVDRLIPLSDLPSLVFAWWPGATAGALKVLIAFDSGRLETLMPTPPDGATGPSPEQSATILNGIQRAAVLYMRVHQQLADTRISASVTSKLWQQNQQPVVAAQKQQLVDFVGKAATLYGDLYDKLSAAAMAAQTIQQWRDLIDATIVSNLGTAKDLNVLFDFGSEVSSENFIELTLEIQVQRPFDLVGQEGGFTKDQLHDLHQSAVTISLPFRDDKAATPAWITPLGDDTATVAALAKAFKVASPDRQCATGYSGTPGLVDRAIWLVRTAVLPGNDDYDHVTRTDFAVPPVSTHLHSGDIPDLDVFTPGAADAKKPFSFRDADADNYAREALRRIDASLAPFVLKGVASQTTARDLHGVLDAKRRLAEYFSGTTLPIFAGVEAPILRTAAGSLLKNRFQRKLELIYDLDTLVAYGDPETAGSGDAADIGPQAYGTIVVPDDAAEAAKVNFEPFNLPLALGAKHLFLACDAAPGDHDADSAGGTVPAPQSFSLTHVQRLAAVGADNSQVGDPGRYRPTAWLKLVEPTQLALKDERGVPVAIRRMPRKPGMVREAFSCDPVADTGTAAERLRKARAWTTDRDWTYEAKNVDKLTLTLRFNGPDDTNTARPPSEAAPPQPGTDGYRAWAFVRFVAATEGVYVGLQGSDAAAASQALAFFENQAQLLCTALAQRRAEEAAADEQVLVFSVAEQANGNTRVLSVKPVAALPAAITFSVATLGPDGNVVQAWSGDATNIQFTEDASVVDRRRRIGMAGLDVLGHHRSVRTELDLTRNAQIDGRDVALSFVYVAPTIASGSMTRPLLDRSEDVHLDDGADTVANHFARLFDGIRPPADLANNVFVADIFVTFEPWLSPDGDSVGEGTFITAWRGASLAADTAPVRDALAQATNIWLSSHKPQPGPSPDIDSRLVIEVRIYDGLQNGPGDSTGTGQCVLRLRRCTIELRNILGAP